MLVLTSDTIAKVVSIRSLDIGRSDGWTLETFLSSSIVGAKHCNFPHQVQLMSLMVSHHFFYSLILDMYHSSELTDFLYFL